MCIRDSLFVESLEFGRGWYGSVWTCKGEKAEGDGGCIRGEAFVFEEKGKIREYPGNYSVYLDYKKAEESKQQKTSQVTENNKQPNSNNESPPSEAKKRHRLSNWERKEFVQLEEQIAQLETEKAEVEAAMGKVTASNYSQVQELYEQVETLNNEIDVATERWLELAEIDS